MTRQRREMTDQHSMKIRIIRPESESESLANQVKEAAVNFVLAQSGRILTIPPMVLKLVIELNSQLNILKIDYDRALKTTYGLQGIPTVIFNSGRIVQMVGLYPSLSTAFDAMIVPRMRALNPEGSESVEKVFVDAAVKPTSVMEQVADLEYYSLIVMTAVCLPNIAIRTPANNTIRIMIRTLANNMIRTLINNMICTMIRTTMVKATLAKTGDLIAQEMLHCLVEISFKKARTI